LPIQIGLDQKIGAGEGKGDIALPLAQLAPICSTHAAKPLLTIIMPFSPWHA
jgi:hypothetical protein